jgi:hypothetical protein
MTQLEKVLIVHGYAAHGDAHWFPWLRARLAERGVVVEQVRLPDASAPVAERWEAAVLEALGSPDERIAVVAHSLGGVTTLRALERLDAGWSLSALVLVAGFTGALASLPQLDGYLEGDPDAAAVAAHVRSVTVVRSDGDPFVPLSASDDLAARMGARVEVVPGGGHLLDVDGFVELPVVLAALDRR